MRPVFKVGDRVIANEGFRNRTYSGVVVELLDQKKFVKGAGQFYRVYTMCDKSLTFNESELILDSEISKLLYL